MRKFALFLALLMLLSFPACGGTGSGGDFTYYLRNAVNSLDPQTATGESSSIVLTALFEGLCRVDGTGKAAPGAADSWEANESDTQFTFHLRKDLKWSDGTDLVAGDFVYGFRRAVAPDTKASNLEDIFILKNAKNVYDGALDSNALGVSAPDNYTLVVELERPDENFPALTADSKFMPCQREFFLTTAGRYGLQSKYLLTNGPFAIYSWEENGAIQLVPNSSYRGEAIPKPKSLRFTAVADEEILQNPAAALSAGTADVLPLTYEESVQAADSGCNVVHFNNRVTGLVFNTGAEYLQEESLRELFVKTIDRDSVLSVLPEDVTATNDIVPDSILWGSGTYRESAKSDCCIQMDKSICSQLPSVLDQLELGHVPSFTVLCPDDDLSKSIANKVIISWNGILGNYFNILPLPQDEFEAKIAAGDYQIALCTVASTGDTPYSFLKAFESTGSPKLLTSTEYDKLLHGVNKGLSEYEALEDYLNSNYIFYPIHKEKSYFGVSPKVKGLQLSIGHVDFLKAAK